MNPGPPLPDAVSFVADPTAAAALLKPLRRDILRELRETGSASSVARTLGIPRQRAAYHVRTLEQHGLLEHVGDRRRGNCVERLLRASATSYLIDPLALDDNASRTAADRFSSEYLLATAARLMSDVGHLRSEASSAGKTLPTLTIETEVCFASADDQAAFAEELAANIAQVTSRYHKASAPDSRTFRFIVGGHPARPVATSERGDTHDKQE